MVSSSFRVTQRSLSSSAVDNMQSTLSRLANIQAQISSNRRIQRPSDDPVGTIAALRLRNDLDQNTQIDRNLSDATSWLNLADSTLGSVVDQVTHLRDLALQAKNGALGQSERDAIATEMGQVRQSLLGLANTQFGGRAIFGGTASGPAYDTSGNFIGQSAAVERTIAPNVRVQINVNGDAVFGANGSDLFTVINNLAAQVSAGNTTGIDAQLTALDTRTQTIQGQLADVGARTNRVTLMQDRNDQGAVTLKQNLSEVEDIDLPKAIVEMQMQQVAYQAALATTAKVIQPTLVDFLR